MHMRAAPTLPHKPCSYTDHRGWPCKGTVSPQSCTYETAAPMCRIHVPRTPRRDQQISIAHLDKGYKTQLRWDE